MEGIEKLELLELNRSDKKIRLYLPKYSDLFYPSLGSKKPLDMLLHKDYIEEMIQQRKDARKAKDYIGADRIRNELKYKGIVLYDKKEDKTVWDWESGDLNIFTLKFQIPEYVFASISLYFNRYGNRVWWEIHHGDMDNVFNKFHLATDFTLYMRGEEHPLVNTWDDTIKTMIVHKELSEDDAVVFWYRD